MKRRIAIIVLLLVGGAIVNIAVAWIGNLAWTTDQSVSVGIRSGLFTPSGEWLDFQIVESQLFTQIHWAAGLPHPALNNERRERSTSAPPHWSLVPALPGYMTQVAEGHEKFLNHLEIGSGAPVRSFVWYGRFYRWQPTPNSAVLQFDDYVQVTPYGQSSRVTVLPLRPIWPGFIINTLFYALLLWLLFAAPFAARRALRRRRGQCEKCAYPIGVSPVCTECGAAVRLRSEGAQDCCHG